MQERLLSAAAAIVAALGLSASVPAIAAPIDVVVCALQNSSSGTGVDLDTGLDLVAGDRLVSRSIRSTAGAPVPPTAFPTRTASTD